MFSTKEEITSERAFRVLREALSVDAITWEHNGDFSRFVRALFGNPGSDSRLINRPLIENVRTVIERADSPANTAALLSAVVCMRDVFDDASQLAEVVWSLPYSAHKFGTLPVSTMSERLEKIFANVPSYSRKRDLFFSLIELSEQIADDNATYEYRVRPYAAKVNSRFGASESKRNSRNLALHSSLPRDLQRLMKSKYLRRLVAMSSEAPDEMIIDAHRRGIPRPAAIALWNQRTPPPIVDRIIEIQNIEFQVGVVEHARVSDNLLERLVKNGLFGELREDAAAKRFFPLDDSPVDLWDEFDEISKPQPREVVSTEVQLRAARRLAERGLVVELRPRQITTGDLHLRVALCEVATPHSRPQSIMRDEIDRVYYGLQEGFKFPDRAHEWADITSTVDKSPFPIHRDLFLLERVPFGWTNGRKLKAHIIRDGLELDRDAFEMNNCARGFRDACREGREAIVVFSDEGGVAVYNARIAQTDGSFSAKEEHIWGVNNMYNDPRFLMREFSRAITAARQGERGIDRLLNRINGEIKSAEKRRMPETALQLEVAFEL